MTTETKTCSLTDEEIEFVMTMHSMHITRGDDPTEAMERLNYLHKRLKTKPKDGKPEEQPKVEVPPEQKAAVSW